MRHNEPAAQWTGGSGTGDRADENECGDNTGDFSSCRAISVVVIADAEPGVVLDHDVVPELAQFPHRSRGQPDTVFLDFDFLRHTDFHDLLRVASPIWARLT